jgi:aminoglycoside phosphotransferase (APT) family kinase protein
VTAVEPLEPGNRRETAVVRFADAEPAVIRRTTDPEAARVEAALLTAIDGRTSVPVAAPIASGSVDGDGWLATPVLAGNDLHESFVDLGEGAQERIVRSFGRYLAELHDAFRFESYGKLTLSDGELVVDTSGESAGDGGPGVDTGAVRADDTAGDWRAWLVAVGRASVARLPAEFDPIRSALTAALDRVTVDAAPVARLFPWDLRPGNALVDDGRVTAVLDWEDPLAAAPSLSVAKTEYLVADWYVAPSRAESLRDAFRGGYESVREYPEIHPIHRLVAIAEAAVDSRGGVTNPGYPPAPRAEAVAFHRRALRKLL